MSNYRRNMEDKPPEEINVSAAVGWFVYKVFKWTIIFMFLFGLTLSETFMNDMRGLFQEACEIINLCDKAE